MAKAPVFFIRERTWGWLAHVGVPLFGVAPAAGAAQDAAEGPRRVGRWTPAAFSELSLYGGWRTTPEEYVAAVKRYDREIGQLEWAAGQDYMWKVMLARTGLSVEEHQRRTVANSFGWSSCGTEDDDTGLHPEAPFMPTSRVSRVGDYLRCWDMFGEAGVDLSNYPSVGVRFGVPASTPARSARCWRRCANAIRECRCTVMALRHRDFGTMVTCLRRRQPGVGMNARKIRGYPGCTHGKCSNCVKWALRWRRGMVAGGDAEARRAV